MGILVRRSLGWLSVVALLAGCGDDDGPLRCQSVEASPLNLDAQCYEPAVALDGVRTKLRF